MPGTPLSTPLSHLLIAFTIELDNEFERRLAEAAPGGHVRVSSLVTWSNFLRFVGRGVTVGDLPGAAGLPKARVLSTLGGMERWRYVWVGASGAEKPPEVKRGGWGSARGLRSDWVVRPTPAGLVAQEIWPPLQGEIERSWEARLGREAVDELRRSLRAVIEQLDLELPEYLPVVTGTNGMAAEITALERRGTLPAKLSALLSQVLAYTIDFERESELSLPLSANVVRVLDETGLDVRDLPKAAAVSGEATSMALTFLKRNGYVVVEPDSADARAKVARLTPKGGKARDAAPAHHAAAERSWEDRFGRDNTRRLRAALRALLDQRDGGRSRLALGLEPYPDGWRASDRYLEQTEAMLDDPRTGLPRYPMVLHRGGWPDGS